MYSLKHRMWCLLPTNDGRRWQRNRDGKDWSASRLLMVWNFVKVNLKSSAKLNSVRHHMVRRTPQQNRLHSDESNYLEKSKCKLSNAGLKTFRLGQFSPLPCQPLSFNSHKRKPLEEMLWYFCWLFYFESFLSYILLC